MSSGGQFSLSPDTLRTFDIDGEEVDMLVIFDRPMKPYVLAQDSPKGHGPPVRAHHVYTRIGDRNTPIHEGAPPPTIERMWRERFGLTVQPRRRMLGLLRDADWDRDLGNRSVAFHQIFADYRIEFGEWEKINPEPFSFFFTNEDTYLQVARLMFNGTELFSLRIVVCDGGHMYFPEPQTRVWRAHGEEFAYNCFYLDSDQGALLHFLTDGSFDFRDHRGGRGPFLVFADREDADAFEADVLGSLSSSDLAKWKSAEAWTQTQVAAKWNSMWQAGVIVALLARNGAWRRRTPVVDGEAS
jgi:hypothetical protein